MKVILEFRLGLRLRSQFGLGSKEISFNGDDAGIEARSSDKKKLEFPVSIDELRYELRQR
jgi:hypothetical protein